MTYKEYLFEKDNFFWIGFKVSEEGCDIALVLAVARHCVDFSLKMTQWTALYS